ncbi:MAG: AraC family transcriptional regulator [Bacillota bacterium]|nr:AraC family transcriptional regulator [Bacillota bacterium]
MRYINYELTDSNKNTLLRFFHSTVPSGRRMLTEHHHTECEIAMFISGGGIYTVGKKEYKCLPGDVLLFGSDEQHYITDIFEGEKFDIIGIQFEPRFLWSEQGLFDFSLMKLFIDRTPSFENLFDRNNPSAAKIKEDILSIEREFSEKNFNYPLMIKLYICDILMKMIRDFGYVATGNTDMRYGSILKQLSISLDYINSHLEEDITLEALSSLSAMNKTYFSTVFKKFNGISAWDYITIKRVEKAIALLKNTNLKKLDISQRCGFNSSSNFYKSFIKVTGKSPGDYVNK